MVGVLSNESNETWQYALLGGLVSIPFTAASYLQTGSELSLAPVFFGALLAGFLAERAAGSNSGVGVRAGLIGGLPAVLLLVDLLAASSGLGGPAWFVALGLALLLGFAAVVGILAFGLAALVGIAGARVGGWLADRGSRRRPPATGG
ncbi:DUF5518 domain-containing protein [Natrinema versiforme]|uniref:DUF5518 domain-containing protein n=1 Tax=Natrinema versiforme JCM 10478 TaxID=1227496 RepID=L9XP04_9EURY|nr:DUF5518 domain-containing protein [Natrinema versiforme]ELY63146.1 hypothetical protein C489_20071 [Natrinema versiforme JCM 10478]